MKKLIAIVMMLPMLIGCNHKPKSPVETRFEQYIQTENLASDFVKIDSIILIDSVNLPSHYEALVAYNDSLRKEIFDEIEFITPNLQKLKTQSDAIAILKIVNRVSEATNKDIEAPIKEKISIFLEDIPDHKSWYTTYKISANFKEGQKTFYAHNFAFEDTITISTDVHGGLTRKSERLTNYFVDYTVKVSAPKGVILDELKEFSNKLK